MLGEQAASLDSRHLPHSSTLGSRVRSREIVDYTMSSWRNGVLSRFYLVSNLFAVNLAWTVGYDCIEVWVSLVVGQVVNVNFVA
jgi:hypothetical protein